LNNIEELKIFRKHLLSLIAVLIPALTLQGQTDASASKINLAYPVYSQYLHNGLLINPAYAGSREVLSVFVSGRQQWAGIQGAPRLETVSLHSLLKNDRVGLGLSGQFYQYGDAQYGISTLTSVYADYAYHIRLGKGKLSLGLKAGFDMSSTKYTNDFRLTLTDPNDPVFASNETYFLPNVGGGVYYYSKKFFIGAAVPSFLNYKRNSDSKLSFNALSDFNVNISAGALVTFTDGFKFKPSVFIDYSVQQTKKMRVDLNGNFIISDIIWIGGSWRTSEDVAVGILQFQITPQLMIGYSYDYPVGRLNNYSNGSHEIIFRYEFSYKVNAANPRYF
jgi:type IX secretion system PorP/SprF family membrane protein